jgi:hypothetical protein
LDDVRGPLEFSVVGAVAAVTTVVGPMLERGSGPSSSPPSGRRSTRIRLGID